MALRISDIGEPIGWASTGMVFKHKHEDKVIKIMPRVPSRYPTQYIHRKLDDEMWMISYGWTYLASDTTTLFWRNLLRRQRQDPMELPNWLPKVYDASSARINYETMWNLVSAQIAGQYPDDWDDIIDSAGIASNDELLSVFTSSRLSKVAVNYIIMEYLPDDLCQISPDDNVQAEINSWFWNENATVIRDILENDQNYMCRANGEIVYFDPVMSMLPSPKAFAERKTMNSMAFVEMFCNTTDPRETYETYLRDLQPMRISGQYCLPDGPIDEDSDYLNHEWYRSEEPSLDDFTLHELANSNVVGDNWQSNVDRYA